MAEHMTPLDVMTQERRNSGTSPTRNEEFDQNAYLKIENFWDPEELYHPLPGVRGQQTYTASSKNVDKFDYLPVEGQVEGSLARYWHPQYRKIHSGVRKKLEKIIGRKLYNTYYYDRFYFPGQPLTLHADRDACEISVSIHISTNLPDDLKDWPFKIKTPDTYTDAKKSAVLVPGEERSVVLQAGDGLLYKGCERPHWRDPMPTPRVRRRDKWLKRPQPEYYYHQIFFHYVLADGHRAHCYHDMSR
tara:strand:+ start:654 stop:1391 length:738 start_codon:yes stop_codon:yes gene_type:complete